MKLLIIFFVFLALILLDKGLTIMNIKQTWNNFPDDVKNNPYKIERNPIAKWSFERYGLYSGTALMIFISLAIGFIALGILKFFFNLQIALYIIILAYGFTIANNFYFLLKFSKLI